MNPIFESRIEAGRLLARKLSKCMDREDVLVLVRGGVPVAFEVAQKLHAPSMYSQTTGAQVRELLARSHLLLTGIPSAKAA
jgi:hypothetical protein